MSSDRSKSFGSQAGGLVRKRSKSYLLRSCGVSPQKFGGETPPLPQAAGSSWPQDGFPSGTSIASARILPVLLLLFSSFLHAEGLKVICASRAAKPPVIDGLLNDPCWQKTEARSDFVSVAGAKSVSRLTVMRAVYDHRNLYLGFELHWEDIGILEKGIQSIVDEFGKPEKKIVPIRNFKNRYGLELFIDPGATQSNYYQILFNAAGQYTGNYRNLWDRFTAVHEFRSMVHRDRWTVEYVYPVKGLKPGDEWGINIVRNDESYYAMWRHISGAFAQPKLFGRLVIGSYEEWWNAVFKEGTVQRIREASG
ncbi:MAG: hypothetical protein QF473_30470, partial [Planctomycetota bacterium]|nr:hypothetical protein [Planctomycetota bacterium]